MVLLRGAPVLLRDVPVDEILVPPANRYLRAAAQFSAALQHARPTGRGSAALATAEDPCCRVKLLLRRGQPLPRGPAGALADRRRARKLSYTMCCCPAEPHSAARGACYGRLHCGGPRTWRHTVISS